MLRVIGCLTQQHDLRLVALAACICALACGATFNLVACARYKSRRSTTLFLAAASVIAGGGVWSLHFVAMLAFNAGVPIEYNIPITAVSAVIPMLGMFGALCCWQFRPSRREGAVLGGIAVGASISAMHYSGVMAMHVPGTLRFDQGMVWSSIGLSMALAVVALLRAKRLASYWHRLEATCWLALSIFVLHFTGMSALSIELGPWSDHAATLVGSETLAVCVGTVSVATLLVSLAATIMEQHLAERAVMELDRMRRLSDLAQEVLIVHRDWIVLQVNVAGCRLFGLSEQAFIGRNVLDLVAEADRPKVCEAAQQTSSPPRKEEICARTPAAASIPVEFSCHAIEHDGKPASMIAMRDLSDRKRDEARIRHLAHHDVLTDLPNRLLLHDRLETAIAAAKRWQHCLALLYLDLDGFKPVNDLLGHAAGDAVLVEVARRLRAQLRATDTVARVGGDEFVIVATLDRPESADTLATRLIEAIAVLVEIGHERVQIGTSVGVAFYPRDGESEDALMHAADMALYRAKHDRRGSFRVFDPNMDERVRHRQLLARDLASAIERKQLQLHFQPQVNCTTGEVAGFEALLRWHHPELGLIPTAEFIPLAEETRLIVGIGQWVLETACRAAVQWKEPHFVAVNVSPAQFREPDWPAALAATLARSGLPPERLEIEVTEGVLIADAKRAIEVLSAVHAQGVRVTLDDFGSGFSSLSYLHSLRLDKLKIDKSFVMRLGAAEDARIIVRSIIGLAHNLGLSVIAEGVETPEQLAVVRELMADQAQGFLLGRPMQLSESTELVKARVRMLFADIVAAKTSLRDAEPEGTLERTGLP